MIGLILATLLLQAQPDVTPDRQPPTGSSLIGVAGWGGPTLRVFTHVPEGYGADTPVLFIMHGVRRNADDYRDAWVALADACGLIILAPEFTAGAFPGAANYNLGGVAGEGPAQARAFNAIEPIFEGVRASLELSGERYWMFGHSAGAQFVHRYVSFSQAPNLGRAVAANAGWYTLPDRSERFPYGWRNAPVEPVEAADLFGHELVILLGEADNDPDAPFLRTTREANRQGRHRFARGETFYETARLAAAEAGVAFNWSLGAAPGIGHDNARMAGPALAALLDGRADLNVNAACRSLISGD
jgi:poly(3-hydroxybutyrate) depolymerase